MSVYAFESVTVSTTAVTLTSATFDNATKAVVSLEGATVRFRPDDTDPTAAIGHELVAGDVLTLETPDEIQRVSFISKDGGTGTLRVTYFV